MSREHRCTTCRTGYEQMDELDEIKKSVLADCDNIHSFEKCTAWNVGEKVQNLQNGVEYLKEHRRRVGIQSAAFSECKATLGVGEILILMDFSPYSKAYRKERGMDDAMTGTQCLHMCVYEGVASSANGAVEPSLSYYDHFAQESNDYHFVRRAFLRLFSGDGPLREKRLRFVWSDGGPKHFKTKRAIGFLLVELPLLFKWTVMPEWHFFISLHGKSLCDAHASNVKRIFKFAAKCGAKLHTAKDLAARVTPTCR